MTDFDNTWDTHGKPGLATVFFDAKGGPPPFEGEASGFSLVNAWWLSELSRLIYRMDGTELGTKAKGPSRQDILEAAGLRETAFFNRGTTQCAITQPAGHPSAFAALAFRGSTQLGDWLSNYNSFRVPCPQGGQVHKGLRNGLDSVWPEVAAFLEGVDAPLFITGHSRGGGLAIVAGTRARPCSVYTYGSPKPGPASFARALEGVKLYRVVNHLDRVQRVPPSRSPFNYVQHGELHYIAHDDSILVNPSEQEVAEDQAREDPTLKDTTHFRKWNYPPHFLLDHTPLNYTAHMENQPGWPRP